MKRRRFAALLLALLGSPLTLLRAAWAQVRRLLPTGTDLGSLLYEDPATLDPSRLPLTPIKHFGTVGPTDHRVDLGQWRLEIGGAVTSPLRLTLAQLLELPTVERDLLLICPGTFAYHARWRGPSLWELLQQAEIEAGATHIEVLGPPGPDQKRERFELEEVRNGRVFLAHGVNGVPLPEKHGFPLRIVADGHVGTEWVKYVYRVKAVIGEAEEAEPPRTPGPAFLP